MTREIYNILLKEVYTIQDVATIVGKTTDTVRSWETKKITPRLNNRSDNGWKQYTRRDLEILLEHLLNYNWERKVIKNEKDLKFIIRYCRGFIKLSDYPYTLEEDKYTDKIKEKIIFEKDMVSVLKI